jgi:hypothetical protein
MRILAIILLAMAVTSCGTLQKHKQIETLTQQKDSTARKVTVIREKVDTVVKVAGSSTSGSKPVENLLAGDSLVLENDGQRVVVKVDQGGNVNAVGTIKPREIPITIDREIKHEDETHVTTDTRSKATELQVKRTTTSWTWLAIPLALIIFLLVILRQYWKRLL